MTSPRLKAFARRIIAYNHEPRRLILLPLSIASVVLGLYGLMSGNPSLTLMWVIIGMVFFITIVDGEAWLLGYVRAAYRTSPGDQVIRLGAIAAACLLASGCALGSTDLPRGTATYHSPHHWVTMRPGQTRLFSPGVLAAPLTVACPGVAPRTGIKQVIHSSLRPGFGGIYGDSMLGNSLDIHVSGDGAVSITCS